MGFFSNKKYDMYEKNARIAELESKNDALTEKLEQLKAENAELRVIINRLKANNEAIQNENYIFSKESEAEGESDEEADSDLRDVRSRILRDKEKAFELKRVAMEKYALELKRLKLFSQKWQSYYNDSSLMEKRELSNLLSDILSTTNSVEFLLEAKAKTDEIFKVIGEPFDPESLIKEHFDSQETEFNLDDAVNPKGELNLEDLCKELGVFNG